MTAEKREDRTAAKAVPAFGMPDLAGLGSLRAFAMGVGDARLIVEAEVQRVLAEHDGNAVEACKEGLARLQALGAISAGEARQLGRILVLFAQHQRGRLGEDAAERIFDTYRAIAVDPEASPIAIAIASACSGHVATHPRPNNLSAATTANVNIGVAGGAVAGGLFGFIVGGPVGGALGAGLGSIVGAVAGACSGD